MADVPAPVETNRGPRVRTNSKGIGSFIPPELKETGRRAVNLASAIDPIQGLMRGMSASGRAADTELSPEERKAAAIEAGVETFVPLAMMGMGRLAKQPVKATLLDLLTPTGAPASVTDTVASGGRNVARSGPTRREFMKGIAATGGIAAIAPDVFTEALEKVPAAVKKLKPAPNPIDIFTQNMKILRREMEEAYDAADDMPVGMQREAYDEAIQQAEKLAYDLDATTEMDLRELISDIGPKEIAEAADESLEEISQALTDFRMVSEDEYIEQMIPLAEEIQRRGLLEVKDNGISQYPYARTVVEDVEDYLVGENRARNNSAIIDRPRDLQMMEADKYVTSNQQALKQEQLRNIIIDGKADGESVEAINKKVVDAATRLKVPYPQRAFENPKVEYVNTQTIADNVAQFNFPRYDVGKFGGDFESGDMANMPGVLEKFQASGKETLKENIFNEGIKEPIEIEVVMSNGGINIGQGHHRLQAALELGIPEIPVIVTTKANPRAQGMEVMRPATLDTSGLKTGQTYSFSELGLKKRLKTPKETPEEIQARGGTVFSDFSTGDVSDRKFPQYETPMREGFFRVVDEKADGGEMRKGVGSLSEIARRMNEGGEVMSEYRKALIQSESSGRVGAQNPDTGAVGLTQGMSDTVDQFRKETNRDFTAEEYAQSRDLQTAFQDWYEQTTLNYIAENDLDQYLGETIKGVPITVSSMMAMAHLGGNFGMKKFLETGGRYDPDDKKGEEVGTRLSDYGRKFAGLNPYTEESFPPMNVSDEEIVMSMPVEQEEKFTDPRTYNRPLAKPPVTYDGPRPMPRPTQQQMIQQAVASAPQPQSLQEKYSPQGIEQMLTGTIGEPLLPRQFQQGSPYSSMQ